MTRNTEAEDSRHSAPVPAGGTPGGLAREKVDEQRDAVKTPAAPTTEAGRTLEREIGGDYGEEIAGIEAEARAAARKEVLDEMERGLRAIHEESSDPSSRNLAASMLAALDSLSTDTREEPSDE
jgi:hypothetical protein